MGQQSIAHKISYLQKTADQFLILISGTEVIEDYLWFQLYVSTSPEHNTVIFLFYLATLIMFYFPGIRVDYLKISTNSGSDDEQQ